MRTATSCMRGGGSNKTHVWYKEGTIVLLCLFALCLSQPVLSQNRKKKGDDKVYLDHADELTFDQAVRPGVQILRGHVRFRYQDTSLTCDSAYFNQERNTFQAFGHVTMRKRGGITLTCLRAKYDGMLEMVQARQNVVLTQPGRSLHTDSLDYNTGTNYANFYDGGRLVSDKTSVVSRRGEYYLDTHESNFYEDVVMRSPKYTIETDHLNYNTHTEQAHIIGPSVIKGKNGEIVHTEDGYYDNKIDKMELMGWSTITTKDRDVEGDNLNYNSTTGDSEGHGNVKITDKLNNRVVTGDNLYYNEKTHKGDGDGNIVYTDMKNRNTLTAETIHYTDSEAVAYGRPVIKDFSQKDTLYMHADTLRMYTYHYDTDSVYRRVLCYPNVRAYRKDVQAVCGLLVFNSKDSCMTMYRDPVTWSDERQLFGDSIKIYMNDSTVREAYVFSNAMSIEKRLDQKHFNQVASREMRAFFEEGKVRRTEAIGNVLSVYFPEEEKDSSVIGLNYMETDTLRMFMSDQQRLEKIWVSKPEGTLYPITQVPPGKEKLPGFAWYDYLRPIDKDDIFRTVTKESGKKKEERQVIIARPPRQVIKK